MAKNMIIEAQNSNTEFEQSTNKGILGKLAGVFADYSNGTRNGRLYNEQLWDERVFGSEDVQEALETKTLFGELDHPDGDRCETLAQNAAITITKLEKRPDEGVIYGEAEILDTPTGRIVKALADSGAKLGVSSRGMGEEINEDGQNIIDPSSYDFITFDVVVTPANTKARVSLVESKRLNTLTESLKKEIVKCDTENQLNQVKNVVETINISNKDELNKLIEGKLQEINPDENPDEDNNDDMVTADSKEKKEETKLSEANKKIAFKLLETRYLNLKKEYDESLKANEELHQENEKLIEARNQLRRKTLENKKDLNRADKRLEETKKLIKQRELVLHENKLREQEELISGNKSLITKMNAINKKKVENIETKYKNEVKKLNEQLKVEDKRYNKLLEENKKITESIKLNAKLVEDKDTQIKALQEQLNKVNESNAKKLQESKSLQDNKVIELNKKVESLLAENKQLKLEREQFTDLAFTPTQGLVSKELDTLDFDDYSAEDQALFNALL